MEVMTKYKLNEISNKLNFEIVDRITHSIYGKVIHTAEHLMGTRVVWNTSEYIFGDTNRLNSTHMFLAYMRLKNLFPDSRVIQTAPLEITVDWS